MSPSKDRIRGLERLAGFAGISLLNRYSKEEKDYQTEETASPVGIPTHPVTIRDKTVDPPLLLAVTPCHWQTASYPRLFRRLCARPRRCVSSLERLVRLLILLP